MIIPDFSDELLLQEIADARGNLERYQRQLYTLESEALRRMAEKGATAIPSDTFVCEMQVSNTYDQSRFTPLKEVFTASDLDAAFTPEHDEVKRVPDKWNTVKVLALARRYGDQALRCVEEARVRGAPRLKFERKV